MSRTLEGKVALVTGGSRNIGRETALALAAKGADVVITYRTQEAAAAEVITAIQGFGRRGRALQVDLEGTAGLPAFTSAFEDVLAGWDRANFDILVNNAGMARIAGFDAVTEADLDAIYNTNFKSVVFLTQALAPLLADGGRIVNLSSRLADVTFPPLIAYGPLKAALQSMTGYWAKIMGGRGITVNAVAPGGLDDDFNTQLFDDIMPGARDYISSNTALGRVGLPKDVSGVIAFLCQPEARFISGATIKVDGGYAL